MPLKVLMTALSSLRGLHLVGVWVLCNSFDKLDNFRSDQAGLGHESTQLGQIFGNTHVILLDRKFEPLF